MAQKPRQRKKRSFVGEDLQERKRQRRNALIAAGLDLFGTKGYRNCSVKSVCNRARLTERYFYESFQNREALLVGLFDVLVAEMAESLLGVLQHPDYDHEKRLKKFIEVFFRFLRDDERKGRLILFEILGVSPEMDRHYHRAVQGLATLVEHPKMGLFASGRPRTRSARHIVSVSLVGALLQIALQWALDGFKTSPQSITNNTLQIFLAVSERHG